MYQNKFDDASLEYRGRRWFGCEHEFLICEHRLGGEFCLRESIKSSSLMRKVRLFAWAKSSFVRLKPSYTL